MKALWNMLPSYNFLQLSGLCESSATIYEMLEPSLKKALVMAERAYWKLFYAMMLRLPSRLGADGGRRSFAARFIYFVTFFFLKFGLSSLICYNFDYDFAYYGFYYLGR
jgi:hypothetical protein